MTTINVYVLSYADCQAIFSINSKYTRGPQIIICDYGAGACVEESVVNDPMYSEWYVSLNALVPFSSRSTVSVDLPTDLWAD